MSMRDALFVAALLLLAAPAHAQTPNLGQPITPQELAAWDISIETNGAGLPAGGANAVAGAAVYAAKCAGCHGAKGQGQPSDRLVGDASLLRGDGPPGKTVGNYWAYATTLFDYIHRAMPLTQPQSLTPNETYGVSAYILFLNGIVGEKEVMNARTLPKVKMPARELYFVVYPGAVK